MNDILLLAIRVVAGGTLVVAFAMVSDMLKPKMRWSSTSGSPRR